MTSIRPRNKIAYLPVLLLLCLCASVPLQAQRYLGAIGGVVSDPSGAKVSGAKVTVTDNATKFATAAVTSDAGAFNMPALQPGTYTVAVDAAGFKKETRTNVVLTAGQTQLINSASRWEQQQKPSKSPLSLRCWIQDRPISPPPSVTRKLPTSPTTDAIPTSWPRWQRALLAETIFRASPASSPTRSAAWQCRYRQRQRRTQPVDSGRYPQRLRRTPLRRELHQLRALTRGGSGSEGPDGQLRCRSGPRKWNRNQYGRANRNQ